MQTTRPEAAEKIIFWILAGMRPHEVARMWGVGEAVIRKRIKEAGLIKIRLPREHTTPFPAYRRPM